MDLPIIISIDGLSGTGKTTICSQLAGALSADHIAVPPLELRAGTAWFARNADRFPDVAGAFFASALAMALIRASENRSGGKSSILDRYLWSTVAHLAVLGAKMSDMLEILPEIKVDLRVLLTCSENIRSQRISARADERILAGRLAEERFRQLVLASQTMFDFDLIVNTDDLTPSDITHQIMRRLHD